MAQGKPEQASESFNQALQSFSKHGMRLEYARTLHNYGLLLLKRSKTGQQSYNQGMSYLHEAQQIFSECHAALDLQRVEHVLHTIVDADM